MRREPWPSRILRRFARVLAMAFVLLYGTLFAGKVFDAPSAGYVAVILALAFAAVAAMAAWLSDSIGGGMLVVAGVALAICAGVAAERDPTVAILLLSAPFLVAGMTLLSAGAMRAQWQYEQEEDA